MFWLGSWISSLPLSSRSAHGFLQFHGPLSDVYSTNPYWIKKFAVYRISCLPFHFKNLTICPSSIPKSTSWILAHFPLSLSLAFWASAAGHYDLSPINQTTKCWGGGETSSIEIGPTLYHCISERCLRIWCIPGGINIKKLTSTT